LCFCLLGLLIVILFVILLLSPKIYQFLQPSATTRLKTTATGTAVGETWNHSNNNIQVFSVSIIAIIYDTLFLGKAATLLHAILQ
jgi:hypothetical protein